MAHSDATLAGHRRIQRPPTGRRRTLPHMGSLSSDTQVHGGGGRYSATPLDAWRIWGPMGGYAASFALRAAAAEVGDPTMSPASMTVQFFQPAAFEPVDIAVEVRRATRRTAATAVRITQEGRAILDAQVWFAVPDELVVHDHAIRHTAGDPDDHPDIVDLTDESAPFPFWENFDQRVVYWDDDWTQRVAGSPEWSGWLRFRPDDRFDDPVVEACRLLILADLPSFPAAVRAHDGSTTGSWVAPNVDLAVQFHHLADLGDWLLCSGTAPVAARGLIGFRSEVWTRDGRLAASGSGQLITRAVPAS